MRGVGRELLLLPAAGLRSSLSTVSLSLFPSLPPRKGERERCLFEREPFCSRRTWGVETRSERLSFSFSHFLFVEVEVRERETLKSLSRLIASFFSPSKNADSSPSSVPLLVLPIHMPQMPPNKLLPR